MITTLVLRLFLLPNKKGQEERHKLCLFVALRRHSSMIITIIRLQALLLHLVLPLATGVLAFERQYQSDE